MPLFLGWAELSRPLLRGTCGWVVGGCVGSLGWVSRGWLGANPPPPLGVHKQWSIGPIFKAFCDFGGAKMACHGLKKGSFHLFVHPKWSRIIFGKTHFWPIFDPFFVPKQPIFLVLLGSVLQWGHVVTHDLTITPKMPLFLLRLKVAIYRGENT